MMAFAPVVEKSVNVTKNSPSHTSLANLSYIVVLLLLYRDLNISCELLFFLSSSELIYFEVKIALKSVRTGLLGTDNSFACLYLFNTESRP